MRFAGSKNTNPAKEAKRNLAIFGLAVLLIVLAFVVAREAVVHRGLKQAGNGINFENN